MKRRVGRLTVGVRWPATSGDGADGAATPALLIDGEGGSGVRWGAGVLLVGSAGSGVLATSRGRRRRPELR